MKCLSLLVTAAALLLSSASRATVRIVDNNVNAPTPFNNIQDAINASSVGDTVYVQGSATPYYGSVNINRRITLIGPGYNVTGTQYNLPVLIMANSYTAGSIVFDSSITLKHPISGTKIIGINVNTITAISSTYLNNVTIERCFVDGNGSQGAGLWICGNNWIIRNCQVAQITVNPIGHSLLIANNIIGVIRTLGASPLGIVVTNNFLIQYCLSLGYVSFNNNVFWENFSFTNTVGCVFNNNITYGASLVLPMPNTGSAAPNNNYNTGNNNKNNTNPNFVNVPTVNFLFSNIPQYDFTYQAGSPAINAGTDNTNIGISGGVYPITSWTGIPPIPQMQQLNILNPVISQGQQLNINFKARKMN